MKVKLEEIAFVLAISIFSFWGVFFRRDLFAYDSYAWKSFTDHLISSFGYHPFADIVLGNIPPVMILYQLTMFVCFGLSLLFLYLGLRERFNISISKLTFLILLAGAPILIFDFAQFQNELIGYVCVFASFYLVMKGKHFLSLLVCLFGCLSWLGCAAWLVILIGSGSIIYILTILCIVPVVWDKIWGGLFNSGGEIAYNTWGIGFIDFFLLFPCLFVAFLEKDKKLQVMLLISLVLAFFSARFVILCIPLIGLAIGYYLQRKTGDF